MRIIRKLAVLLPSALVVFGVTAASAFATSVHSGSATGPLYAGTVNGVNNGNAVLTDSSLGVTVTCTTSSASGTTDSAGAGSISTLSFTGCTWKGTLGGSGTCTVSTGVPFSAVAAFTGGTHAGTVTVTKSGGSVSATVSCSGLPTCTFSASSVVGDVDNPVGSTHAQWKFVNEPLSGGLCGNATWTTTYDVTGVVKDENGNEIPVDLWLTS